MTGIQYPVQRCPNSEQFFLKLAVHSMCTKHAFVHEQLKICCSFTIETLRLTFFHLPQTAV